MLTPYRVSFFSKLFSTKEYEWRLFAGYKLNKVDSRPQYEGKVDFSVSYHKEKIRNMGIYNEIDNIDMYESVKEFDADIIIMVAHIGTASCRRILKWAKQNKRKVIMWTCFWEPDDIPRFKRLIRNFVINYYYKKADYHIAYSSVARQKLLNIGYPDNQISIAYNGIDVDMYEEDLAEEMPVKELFERNATNILYIGGFGKDKKVDLLIKAISECKSRSRKKINAYLIGDGPMYNECKNLVNQLHISENVKLLGRITKQLGLYIKSADCVVLPGTGGLVLNEAMLFEKPLVVSNADGSENDLLLNGYNGIKFQSGSISSLARALCEISENLSFFQENTSKISEVVTRRSNVDSMICTFLKVIKKLSNEDSDVHRLTPKLISNNPHFRVNTGI